MKKLQYEKGDQVSYRAEGDNELRTVIVAERNANIRNGRPGFSGHIRDNTDREVWGYDDQIICIKRAKNVRPKKVEWNPNDPLFW